MLVITEALDHQHAGVAHAARSLAALQREALLKRAFIQPRELVKRDEDDLVPHMQHPSASRYSFCVDILPVELVEDFVPHAYGFMHVCLLSKFYWSGEVDN